MKASNASMARLPNMQASLRAARYPSPPLMAAFSAHSDNRSLTYPPPQVIYSGARHVFLPPYSPELNPIEEAFSKVKHHVKKHKPRTVQSLCDTLEAAFSTITESDAIGFFNHAESFRAALC